MTASTAAAGASAGGQGAGAVPPGPDTRLVHRESWGQGRIRAAAVSSDGGSIAIATSLGTALYRRDELAPVWFQPSPTWVVSVALSGDGERVISGANDGRAVVYAADSGQPVATLSGQGRMRVALSGDGGRALVADDGGQVTLWDVDRGSAVRTWRGGTRGTTQVAISSDGRWYAAADRDGSVQLWQPGRDAPLLRLSRAGAVHAIAFHPSSPWLAGAGKGWSIWDLAAGGDVVRAVDSPAGLHSLAWSPDGSRLAAGSQRGRAVVWSVADGARVAELRGHNDSVDGLAFAGAEALWMASDKLERRAISGAGEALALPVSGPVLDLRYAPVGEHLAVVDRQLAVVRAGDGSAVTVMGGEHALGGVAFSPDGATLITHSAGEIAAWPSAGGRPRYTIDAGAHDLDRVGGAALRPDGAVLATAAEQAGARRYVIDLWDAATGAHQRRLAEVPKQGMGIQALSYSSDGALLLLRLPAAAVTVDAATGAVLARREPVVGNPAGGRWHPAGTQVASAGKDGAVTLWDPRTGRTAVTLSGVPAGTPGLIAFSPDGARVAVSVRTPRGDQVGLWDARTGNRLHGPLPDPGRVVHCLAFRPDGRWLAAGATREQTDGHIAAWQVDSGAAVPVSTQPAAPVRALAFAPDGRALIAGTGEGGVERYAVE
ncbi:WD40 repeat domain-containing protein [Haliangium sp.]|uniref:WD40 repeat domain-containing protein n=1 Tax=Haliangium sp. TaxID=2663208 RepID=UPI003D0E35CE